MSRLFISFSGGETSAYMAQRLMADRATREVYKEIIVLFANTGQEREETLDFVERCDKAFGLNVVWIEADVQPGRESPKGRVVDYRTAARAGEPFEAMIAKYGIPNSKFPSCTRDLKQRPMTNYLRAQGWETKSYDTAIGIRADEFDRCAADAEERRLIYPLVKPWPTTKPMVNQWWAAQPFRLGLRGYHGNCKWCWKKSQRKLLTLMMEDPSIFSFPERMERQYGLVGPEFKKGFVPGYRRTFFRDNQTVEDLFSALMRSVIAGDFQPASDDAQWFDPKLDGREGGCAEACEVFGDGA